MKFPVKPKPQFSLVYLLIAVLVLSVVQSWLLAPQTVEIPMSKFLALVREGKVERVSVTDREIRGTLKPGALPAQQPGAGDKVRSLVGAEQAATTFTTTRIPGIEDSALVKELEQNKVEFSGRVESTFWRDFLFGWIVPLALMVGLWMFVMRRMGGGPTQALSFGRSKAKIYDRKELKTTFADVAGVDEAKAELMEVVDFLKNPKKYQRLGGRIPKGVLLVGSPGTGKTLLARAVAGEADVPFFFLSGSEFVEMFVGVGASRVRDLFEQAKEKAPCIVFIDELDAIGKTRGGAGGFVGGHDEREQTLNQLLAEMDGFDSSKGVIIMAATNRPEVLDAALMRAGRFDRQVVVDKPDVKGREAILKIHARNVSLAPAGDLRLIAARTPGFAGADLANIVNEAALLAARKGKDAVETADLEEAIDRVVAGLEKRSRVLSEKERDIVAHHEMGHALVGPHNDLERATDLARLMVTRYGMSERLGPLTFGDDQRGQFLRGAGFPVERDYSEETARVIDEEVRAIVERSLARVRGLLGAKKAILLRGAEELKTRETLEGEPLRRLLAGELEAVKEEVR